MPRATPPTSSSSTSSSTDAGSGPMPLDLAAIPIVDNHCHSLLRRQPADDEAFRIHLTEIVLPRGRPGRRPPLALLPLDDPRAGRPARMRADARRRPRRAARARARVAHPRDRRAGQLQDLADRHGLRGRHDVLARRAARPRAVPDRGDPPARAADRAADPRLGRLRRLPRRLPGRASATFASRGIVGLKSVIAYRIRAPARGRRPRRPPPRRSPTSTRPPGATAGSGSSRSRCSTHLVVIAVEESARQGVPIQFHTGLGDPDLDLTKVDPAALRLIFSDRFRAAPIVLLHTGYPYVRSLAYLAAMFPNVYADMGEAILFAAGEATEITRELLGLAPGQQDPVQHRRLARPGAVLGRRAARSAGPRPRPRRAHRRRRDRRADGARLGRADPVAQLGAGLRALIALRARRPAGGPAGGATRSASNSRSSGTSRWPRRPSRRTVMTTMKMTARTIELSPYSRVASSTRRSASPSPTMRIAPRIEPLTEPIPPMTSIVMTRNVRSK